MSKGGSWTLTEMHYDGGWDGYQSTYRRPTQSCFCSFDRNGIPDGTEGQIRETRSGSKRRKHISPRLSEFVRQKKGSTTTSWCLEKRPKMIQVSAGRYGRDSAHASGDAFWGSLPMRDHDCRAFIINHQVIHDGI